MLRRIFISALLLLASIAYFSSDDEIVDYETLSDQTSEEEVTLRKEMKLTQVSHLTQPEPIPTYMSKQNLQTLKKNLVDGNAFIGKPNESDEDLHINLVEERDYSPTDQENTQKISELLTVFGNKPRKNTSYVSLDKDDEHNKSNADKNIQSYKDLSSENIETNDQPGTRNPNFRTIPIKRQNIKQWENRFVKVAASSCQGYGRYMVDQYKVVMKLPKSLAETSYFGVFDGQAGKTIAKFASKQLHNHIIKTKEYSEGHLDTAITNGIFELRKEIQKKPKKYVGEFTSIVCLIRHKYENNEYIGDLFVGNVGDCRGVASINGREKVVKASFSPGITSTPLKDGRLGDSPKPDIISAQINSSWDFILVASDGVWDAMTNSRAVNIVLQSISKGASPMQACSELVGKCVEGSCIEGSTKDNITAILICFLHNKSYKQFVTRCLSYYNV